MTGRIIKGVGSFYTVLTADGEAVTCRARGRFRSRHISPLIGDVVDISRQSGETDYSIDEILPRRNELMRPAIANVDTVFIVMSCSLPQPDMLLCDRLLIECRRAGAEPVIVINKTDEDDGTASRLADQYRNAVRSVIALSAATGESTERLKELIGQGVCCFAGQSAVGKSSLLNALCPELELETGVLSRKTDRGRHTTRHAELFRVGDGFMCDTPGFSLMDPAQMEPWELWKLYPEMAEVGGKCRFPECLHLSEPDCRVKPLIENGGISKERYARYCVLIEELKEARKHRYD